MLHIGLLLFMFLVNPISTENSDLEALQLQCKDGTFGYRCLFTCRCSRDRVCDKETGRCPRDECANGFWGQGCQLDNNCFYNGRARSYMGTKSVTDSQFTCQRWDSQVPHRHSYNGNDFPDRRLPDKFCRATKDASRPWCYTSDKDKRWEHCNINNCNCPTWRFGPNCEKECHCADISEACDSILGICSSGCAQGWEGYNCQISTACATNKYGLNCTKTCYCKNPLHCNRYTGPTDKCECKEGYFHQGDGFCQAVTPPEILYFNNDKVNPGQPAIFNCTVTAYPTPGKDEIRLEGISSDRKVERLQSKELNPYLYTRFNVWKVDSVKEEETVTCAVSGKAGTKTRTIKANVYTTLPQSSYESYHPHSSASAEPLPTKTIDYYHQSLAQSQSYKEPIHPPGTSRTENQPLLKTPQGQKRNYSHCYRPLSPVWRGSMWGKIHRALGGITPHPTPINDKKYHTQD